MADIGQRGEEQPSPESRLPGNVQKSQILDDEAVDAHLLQSPCKAVGRCAFARFDQGVHGCVNADSVMVREIRQACEFGQSEILGFHAGGEMFQAKVHGVSAGGGRCQKGSRVTGWSKDFRFPGVCAFLHYVA